MDIYLYVFPQWFAVRGRAFRVLLFPHFLSAGPPAMDVVCGGIVVLLQQFSTEAPLHNKSWENVLGRKKKNIFVQVME